MKILLTFFLSQLAFGEMHFVHLKAKNIQERSFLANYIHIDQVIEKSIYSVVNDFDLGQLKSAAPNLLIEHHPITINQSHPSTGKDDYSFPTDHSKYHTYDQAVKKMHSLARLYPKITELTTIGKSVEGRDLWSFKITGVQKTSPDQFIPAIAFMGTHHAREHLSTEVPLLLIEHLLKQYKKDTRITSLINTREIYIIPIVNPDGALHDIKGGRMKLWRKNRSQNHDQSRGVDLNRNYSFRWGQGGSSRRPRSDVYMGPKAFSEPETQTIKSFIESKPNIRILLSFHTFSELILYPWGGSTAGIGGKDQTIFETMAKTMAKWNGYKPMQASGLYVATGDTCDWAYAKHGVYCFTFELTPKSRWNGGFYPGNNVIESTFKANIAPALYLIQHAASPKDVLK